MSSRILLIVNPNAGHGRGRKILAGLEGRFQSRGCEVDLRVTEGPGHGRSLVAAADLTGYDGVVAAGGDGTVNEVLNGYYSNPGEKRPPVGIIPAGTGNAFAREMDLRYPDWEKAVDLVARGEIRVVDVARFTTPDGTFVSLNILGVGFVSDVSQTATHLKVLGNHAYLLAVLYHLLKLRTHRMTLTVDGRAETLDACFATVSNSRYTGTTFLIAPGARLDDGLLDLVVVKRISRLRAIRILRTIFSGEHIQEPEVAYHQARRIVIETAEPRVLNVDGEVVGRTPLTIECLPRDLRVFW